MKKTIRKLISEGINGVAAIGIGGGAVTAVLAVLYLVTQNNAFLFAVIAASALTALISAAMSASSTGKLNRGIAIPVEKMSKGEPVQDSFDIPQELSSAPGDAKINLDGGAAEFIAKIADGDFTAKIPEKLKGGPMGDSLSKLSCNINRIFGSMYSGAEEVNNSGEQMSGASMSLSLGAAEQEDTLKRLTSSVGEVKGTVMTNAENAREANRIVASATGELETGTEHMKALVVAMDNINKSTEEITEFIKVIEDIAFQTNILALNSSVEAARAGEAGKGFAVVATEVKNLATRSQEAAQETTAVIEECVRNVREGLAKTQRTAKSIAAVEEETKEISRLINIISCACDEQADAIIKIDEDVERISSGVQNTNIAAQECVNSAQLLATRSGALKSEIGGFRFSAELGNKAPEIKPLAEEKAPVEPVKAPEVKPAPQRPVSRPVPPAPKPVAKVPTPKPVAKAEPQKPIVKTEPPKPIAKAETQKPVTKAEPPKPVTKAEPSKPAAKPMTWGETKQEPKPAPAPRKVRDDSYANAEFVEVPDNKY